VATFAELKVMLEESLAREKLLQEKEAELTAEVRSLRAREDDYARARESDKAEILRLKEANTRLTERLEDRLTPFWEKAFLSKAGMPKMTARKCAQFADDSVKEWMREK
jgi:hypothetical protein